MRQRTGLARALTINSDILLMDEPFSAVDEQMRRKLQEDLLNLLRVENKTVIFVTHSIEEAVYLADQVIILSGRPGSVAEIVYPKIDRTGEIDLIRRQPGYIDLVDEIWSSLKNMSNNKTKNNKLLSHSFSLKKANAEISLLVINFLGRSLGICRTNAVDDFASSFIRNMVCFC